jgi:hypothetical protein
LPGAFRPSETPLSENTLDKIPYNKDRYFTNIRKNIKKKPQISQDFQKTTKKTD